MIIKKKTNILEAIEVEGAVFIGNDRNFDLFKINTWAAAQQFVTLAGDSAGIKYTQSEEVFNTNINLETDALPPYDLYFFVEEDTNRVQTAVLHENRNPHNYTLTVAGTDIKFNVTGFSLEDHNGEANVLHSQYIIPLYVLPFLTTDNSDSYIHENSGLYSKGMYIKDGKLLGVLGWITPATTVNEFVAPEEVIDVSDDACKYQVGIHEFKINMNDRSYNNLIRMSTGIRGIDNMHYIYPDGTTFIVGSGPVPPLPRVNGNTSNTTTETNAEVSPEAGEVAAPPETPGKEPKGRKYRHINNEGNVTIYKKENDGIHIVEIPDIEANTVYYVPNEIENTAVVAIDEFAAFGNESIKRLMFGASRNLKYIRRLAFAYCPNLPHIEFLRLSRGVEVHPTAFKKEPIAPKSREELFNTETGLTESRADDEYDRKYSSIDRDIFNTIIKADPKTRIVNGEPIDIGFGAKGLLLPAYLKGDTSFLEDTDSIKALLTTYYEKQSQYPVMFRNINNFSSLEDFKNFVSNPEDFTTDEYNAPSQDNAEDTEDPLDPIYNKYYSKIPKEIFREIVHIDPTSTESKLGIYAKNLLLPKYLAGDVNFLNSAKKVTKAIEQFIKDVSTYPEDRKEIQNYTSVQEFVDFTNSGPDSEYALKLKNYDEINPETHRPIASEIKFIARTSLYEIVQPLTVYAAKAITGGGWHDNEAMHWCTADPTMNYWNQYTRGRNCDIFCFMHKTKNRGTENRPVNWQAAITRDPKPLVCEFRSGLDESSNDYERKFYKFLLAHPDICEAIANKEPFSRMAVVEKASLVQKALEDGLVISKNSDFEKVIALQPHEPDEEPAGLREVVIKNVKEIPAGIFAGMHLLSKVTFGPGLEIIGAQAFKDCVNLNGIRFPEGLRTIGYEAFMGCTSLKNNVNIPNSTEEIKGGAFMGCHCTLTVEKKREQLGLPLKLDKRDEEWYIKHLKGITNNK